MEVLHPCPRIQDVLDHVSCVRRFLLAGVLGVLAIAPVSGAAASGAWTTPQVLSTRTVSGTPTLAFDARGWAFSTWPSAGEHQQSASRPPSAVAFRPHRVTPYPGEETVESAPPAPVVDDSGEVIALQERRGRDTCGLATLVTLTPRFGRVNGAFARARGGWTISSHTLPAAAALGGNARGAAVVAWMQIQRGPHGCIPKELVRVAVRAPGGKFGTPMTLAHAASAGAIAASVGQDGAVLVAWRYQRTIQMRLRSPAGVWGPVRSVRTGPLQTFAAALGTNDATYLIWTHTEAMGPPEAGRIVGGAVCEARSTRCDTTVLERGTWPVPDEGGLEPEQFAVRLAFVRGGVMAAWNGWAGGHPLVRTAVATGSSFGPARPATPTGQAFVLGALAVSPAGRPALALEAAGVPVRAATGPFVAFGSPDGVFGLPEAVGSGSRRAEGEALAFSPVTGRPTLVWKAYDEALFSRSVLASTGP